MSINLWDLEHLADMRNEWKAAEKASKKANKKAEDLRRVSSGLYAAYKARSDEMLKDA